MSMKRTAILLFFTLLLVGYSAAVTPQEAMMEALKTGNYSLVEPYLSPTMEKAFSKDVFELTRNSLIRSHGEIRGYELTRSEKKGGYTIYYYRVMAERGNYTVSVTVKDGKVEGFHLASLPLRFSFPIIYPIVGALLAFLLLWFYLRKLGIAEVIFGAVLLLIVLVVQPPLQALPKFLGANGTAFTVLWSGLMAALVQEILKYFAARGKPLRKALYIGAGFGLGEGFYVAAISLFMGTVSPLAALERFLALLFHSSTTVLFAYSYRNGWGKTALFAVVLTHWLIDSLAAYWQYSPSYLMLAVSYVVMATLAALILPKLLPLAKLEREENVKW